MPKPPQTSDRSFVRQHISLETLWETVDEFKTGQSFKVTWIYKDKEKSKVGIVKRASNPQATGALRYALVQYPPLTQNYHLPADGGSNTVPVDYVGLVGIDADEELTPVKDEERSVNPPVVSSRIQQMVEARRRQELPDSSSSDSSTSSDEPEDDYDVRAIYLDPSQWYRLAGNELNTFKVQQLLRDHFAKVVDNTKFPAEAYIYADIMEGLMLDVEGVSEEAALGRSRKWVAARETMLARMLCGLKRANGGTPLELENLHQGFQNRKQPQWIQKAHEVAALLAQKEPKRSFEKKGTTEKKATTTPASTTA